MKSDPNDTRSATADAVRRALIQAAEDAFEDAGIRGLCAEGRWEAAVQAMRAVDVDAIARGAAASIDPHPPAVDPHPSAPDPHPSATSRTGPPRG